MKDMSNDFDFFPAEDDRVGHITRIANGLKKLQIEAQESGCRKLGRCIGLARAEALKKAYAVERETVKPRPLEKLMRIVQSQTESG